MSLGETLMRPTTMLFRNQAAMDVEESIRANPFDGVVLMMGCDKTTPALLMGAASCDLPTIGVSGGPMLNGKFRGEDIGSGTHVWKFTEMLKTGEMKMADMVEVESCMSRSAGHCMTMGTASTMASMVEALGMGLPTNAAIPAVDSRRRRAGADGGTAHRRDGARGPADVEDPHQAGVRERDHGQRRDRRLDQRRRASAGHRRAHRRQAVARRLGPPRARHAVPRRPACRRAST